MSRSAVHTVNLATGEKLLVLDKDHIPAGTQLYIIISRGIPLPKGTVPGPQHLFTAKAQDGSKKSVKLTCNEQGKYKEYKKDAKRAKPDKAAPAPGAAPKAKKSKAASASQFTTEEIAILKALLESGK